MDKNRLEELKFLASEIRKDVVRMVGVAHSGPLSVPLAMADVFVYLYWDELLLLPQERAREDRDRLLLGIGAAVPALYAALARRGFFDREELWHYRRLGAMLQALPDFRRTPGVEATCATTGTELAMALPLASALRECSSAPRVFCLVSEYSFESEDFCSEAECAPSVARGNLVLLILTTRAASTGPWYNELKDAGWNVFTADGNDFEDMEKTFSSIDYMGAMPNAVFIRTGETCGLSLSAEADREEPLKLDDMDKALEELEGKADEG